MADSDAGAPQAEGGGGLGGRPWWVYGVGVAAVVGFLYWRSKRAAAGSSSSVLPGTTVAPLVDSGTGAILDPQTGLPYLTSQGAANSSTLTMAGWLTAAQSALKTAGFSPALVQQALYDFLNGNTLNAQEGNVINRALGAVGSPPDLLPFLGNIPNPKPPVPTPVTPIPKPVPGPPHPAPKPTQNTPLKAPSNVHLLPGEHFVDQVRDARGGNSGYFLTNLGGIYSVGGAKFEGSYLGLPAATRATGKPGLGSFRTFVDLIFNPKTGGYTEVSSTGEKYTFDPSTMKRGVGI